MAAKHHANGVGHSFVVAFRWFIARILSATFWTALATVFMAITTAVYTVYSRKQWNAMEGQLREMHESIRPWVAFDTTQADKGIGIDDPFTTSDGGRRAAIGLHYWLSNTGRYPANVGIYGKIVEDVLPAGEGRNCLLTDLTCVRDQAESICADGGKLFAQKTKIWSVVPGNPMEYGVTYDGDLAKENHLPAIDLTTIDPNNDKRHDLTIVGCIVYQSYVHGDTPHQTPFLAKVKIRWATPKPEITAAKGLLVIGNAD